MTYKPANTPNSSHGKAHALGRASRNRRQNPFLYPDISPEIWEDQANCKGKAFELFEYQEADSPLCKNMNYEVRLQFNRANFQLAEEICIECPVFFTCRKESTSEERKWTVRGGEVPGAFKADLARQMNMYHSAKIGGDRICQRGHTVKGGGRCAECKKITRLERARRAREGS